MSRLRDLLRPCDRVCEFRFLRPPPRFRTVGEFADYVWDLKSRDADAVLVRYGGGVLLIRKGAGGLEVHGSEESVA